MKAHSSRSQRLSLAAGASFALLLLGGCSTTTMENALTGYRGQAEDMQAALSSGDQGRMLKQASKLDKKCTDANNRILYLEERGRLKSFGGDLTGSTADFQIASDYFEEERMKPAISVASVYFNASAIATNDMALPYPCYGYEKVMLHNYQAINYILDHDYDKARIELNCADVEQVYELQVHQKMADAADSKKQEQNLDLSGVNSQLSDKNNTDKFGATSVKNSFQNALTFYLRGSLYEDSRDYDKALIEYKKSLEIFAANRYVAESAMRMAKLIGSEKEQAKLSSTYGTALQGIACPQGYGHVVVVYEGGFIVPRSSINVYYYSGNHAITVALPYYDLLSYSTPAPLSLSVAGSSLQTDNICNLDAMAVQCLKEEYPGIIIRQILRAVAQAQAQNAANQADSSGLLALAVQVTNIITTRADDRNWLTLPQTIQVADAFLPAGAQSVQCSAEGSANSVPLNIEAGKTYYVVVSKLGSALMSRTAASAAAPAPAPTVAAATAK